MPFNKKQNADLAYDFATNNRHPVNSTLDRAPTPSNKPRSAGTQCVVDTWLLITGDLAGEGELQVDGKVNGNIRCVRLIVGKAAVINGNVTADEVVVRGEVNGIIRAHRVILQDSARVKSDIFHKTLCVDEGARVEGEVRLNEDPINSEVLNPHIVEVQGMAAKMQSSGSDPGRHAATTNYSAA
jgi:cytoskeletal protein CcmA (bactofilin family)